jgi:hypothetical protein
VVHKWFAGLRAKEGILGMPFGDAQDIQVAMALKESVLKKLSILEKRAPGVAFQTIRPRSECQQCCKRKYNLKNQ